MMTLACRKEWGKVVMNGDDGGGGGGGGRKTPVDVTSAPPGITSGPPTLITPVFRFSSPHYTLTHTHPVHSHPLHTPSPLSAPRYYLSPTAPKPPPPSPPCTFAIIVELDRDNLNVPRNYPSTVLSLGSPPLDATRRGREEKKKVGKTCVTGGQLYATTRAQNGVCVEEGQRQEDEGLISFYPIRRTVYRAGLIPPRGGY